MKFLLDPKLGDKARLFVRSLLAIVAVLGLTKNLPIVSGDVETWVAGIVSAAQALLALLVAAPIGNAPTGD
jgi:4-hydroxybenzoate polyprenyltransferase